MAVDQLEQDTRAKVILFQLTSKYDKKDGKVNKHVIVGLIRYFDLFYMTDCKICRLVMKLSGVFHC